MQITAITAHPRPIKLKTPFKLALGELSAITTHHHMHRSMAKRMKPSKLLYQHLPQH